MKTIESIYSNDKMWVLKRKLEFLKIYICHEKFENFPVLKRLFWWNKWWSWQIWFLILCNEMCQHLEKLHNTVNQYFPNDRCMLQNYVLIKDLFKVQDTSMNFSVNEYKQCINMVVNSKWQQSFIKQPLVRLCCGIKE